MLRLNNTYVTREIIIFACARTIRKLRSEAGISQQEVSARVGLSQSYLSNTEQGRHLLSIEKFTMLILGLGFNIPDGFSRLSDEIENLSDIHREYSENPSLYPGYKNFEEFVLSKLDTDISPRNENINKNLLF